MHASEQRLASHSTPANAFVYIQILTDSLHFSYGEITAKKFNANLQHASFTLDCNK